MYVRTTILLLSTVLLASCGSSGSSAGKTSRTSSIGAVFDADSAANSVPETAAVGAAVGLIVNASDPDPSDTISYSLVDNAGGRFAIDATSGEVTVAGELDFEMATSHSITARARSSDGSTSSGPFTISILDDLTEPVLSIDFPASGSARGVHFQGVDLDVAGTVSDPGDKALTVTVMNDNIAFPANIDSDGRWRASNIPISRDRSQRDQLEIRATNTDGKWARATIDIATGLMFQTPASVSIDESRGIAYVVDIGHEALFSIDLKTGQRMLVSSSGFGLDPRLRWTGRLAVDERTNMGYVRSGNDIVMVDLETGERMMLSEASPDLGPVPWYPPGEISLDRAGERLVMGDDNSLLAVYLATGIRQVITGLGLGSGPGIGLPTGVVVTGDGRALVTGGGGFLHSVDLGTRARSVVSGGTVGSGPELDGELVVAHDAARNRALVAGRSLAPDYLIAVDLDTGRRTAVSGLNRGEGFSVGRPTGIDFDTAADRVLIADEIARRVIAIDLESGSRSVVSGNGVGGGAELGQAYFLEPDPASDRVLFGPSSRRVASLDLETGLRTLLFDNEAGIGSGPDFQGTQILAYDPSGDVVYLNTGSGLIGLEFSTGDRELVSDEDQANGPPLGSMSDMVIDPVSNRILAAEAADRFAQTILAIDLATGLRYTLSGPGIGTGPDFVFLDGIELDIARNRVLVPDSGSSTLLAVDITTGNRSVLADFQAIAVLDYHEISRLDFDPDSGRIYVLDTRGGAAAVYELDLSTPRLIEVSGPVRGQGASFDSPTDIFVDFDRGIALVSHSGGREVIKVDLVSGDRVLFAK